MLDSYGIDKITLSVFVPLFESNILTKNVLNQVWAYDLVEKTKSIENFIILKRFGLQW